MPTPNNELLDVNASELLNMLLSSSGDNDQNDDILDLNGDSAWDLGNSGDNLHTNSSVPSGGGSSKPMTEEEQKISVALQVTLYFNQFFKNYIF